MMLAQYECWKCKFRWSQPPAQAVCPRCRHIWVEWLNYWTWDWLTNKPLKEVIKPDYKCRNKNPQ